jgi:transcriptional regulator
MYVPPWNAVADEPTLFEFIDRHRFGLLVTQSDGQSLATHLPFLLDRNARALCGHMARQNLQWRELEGQQALAIFNGPHAYISPTWYQSDKTVPTWNYVAVHVYGKARLIEDPQAIVELIGELTEVMERPMPTPWQFDTSDPFIEKLATQIIGFAIDIERIEGKWKLNQNHPPERRRRVAAALREQGYQDAIEIADLMDRFPPLRFGEGG